MKRILALCLVAALSTSLMVSANAADYTFKAKDNDDYYRSTLYEDIYGSAYNYGGQNVADFYDTSMLPGIISPTPQTDATGGTYNGLPGTIEASGYYDSVEHFEAGFTSYIEPWETAFTSAADLKRSDGSIGTLHIPSLGISRKVYEGTGSDSMNRGLGHFSESSALNGNVALCGHNRGSSFAIGSVKDLKIGDEIQYTTTLGSRSYTVSFVCTISNTDWNYISATADNRITIITCIADQPTLRAVVVAVEAN